MLTRGKRGTGSEMARRSVRDEEETRGIIEGLFLHPPVNEAELAQRIKAVELTSARRVVVDRLYASRLPERDGPLFLAVMGQLGIGRQKRRLTNIALDSQRDPKERLWASMVLTSEDPEAMDMLVGEMGTDSMGSLAELSLFELLTMQGRDEIGESIATALEALVDEKPSDELLRKLEAARKSIGASCRVAYEESLQRPSLNFLRPQILDFFVDEASDDGITCLEKLRDAEAGGPGGRVFQAALLRLRSRQIEPGRYSSETSGYALVSNCDGQGGYVLLGVFDIEDGTHSVADLCIRAGGDIRDGFIYPRRGGGEVDEFVERAKQQLGCHFVEVDLCEAAELVQTGVERTLAMDRAVPDEARRAVALFDGIGRGFRWGTMPCCQSADSVSVQKIEELLARPEYEDTWFFDLGDLGPLGAQLAERSHDDLAKLDWLEDVIAQLDHDNISRRLIAMSTHMARWHAWREEKDLAALCLAMADDVMRSFEKSALVQVMLARSVMAIERVEEEPTYQFGDPKERQHLKMLFFKDIEKPTGRDMAHLDLTEASCSALRSAFDMLPGEHRPRDDELDHAAYAIGVVFADHLIENKPSDPEAVVRELSRALNATCRLSPSERHRVLMSVVPTLYAFADDICAGCLINCLHKPNADMSHVFFRAVHPVMLDPEDEL